MTNKTTNKITWKRSNGEGYLTSADGRVCLINHSRYHGRRSNVWNILIRNASGGWDCDDSAVGLANAKLAVAEMVQEAAVAGRGHTMTPGYGYTRERLMLLGWTAGDGSGSDGHNLDDYFDERGYYRGPDAHGIEPLVVVE